MTFSELLGRWRQRPEGAKRDELSGCGGIRKIRPGGHDGRRMGKGGKRINERALPPGDAGVDAIPGASEPECWTQYGAPELPSSGGGGAGEHAHRLGASKIRVGALRRRRGAGRLGGGSGASVRVARHVDRSE